MATTKIWDVSAHVSKLLAYVANKNKTVMEIENKNFDELKDLPLKFLVCPTIILQRRKRNLSRELTAHPRTRTR